MEKIGLLLAIATVSCIVATPVWAVKPLPEELSMAHKWVAENFKAPASVVASKAEAAKAPEAGLVVIANNDPVQRNERLGKPLKIRDTEYTRGLFCHALSKVLVRLPGAGKTFTSFIGLDANGCAGSVVFSVRVGNTVAFKSPVMKQGMDPVPVKVDLAGAKDFMLEISDAGDGINCDQSDWADAKVVLDDGQEVWIGDLPITSQTVGLPKRSVVKPPFSFVYNGKFSDELIANWKFKDDSKKLDGQRTQRTLTYSDPKTGLVVRLDGIEYQDYPTVEWTLYLKNTSQVNTPVISQLQALDTRFDSAQNQYTLHNWGGTFVTAGDFEPHVTELAPDKTLTLTSSQGRPCAGVWPYFNVETGNGGVITVVGWPGKWSASFIRDENKGVRVAAGQELTRFTLHPGQEIRTPLVVLQFYKGGWLRAQNIWRRWMLAHSMPKPGGKLPPPLMTPCSSHQYAEMTKADEASQIMFVDRYVAEKIKIDYWWMDAGWYPCDGEWPKTGTWEVDRTRFPNGLRAVSDHAKEKGIKTVVWFEPERVGGAGTWLYDNHKDDWLLGGTLLNLGNKDAWTWLTGHINKLIDDEGIGLYRQDYNIDPLFFWRGNDTEDSQGITENAYVSGYLAYWDALSKQHPNMLIDSCASGGHRNDLETMRRSVPLLRSDYIFEPTGQQGHTYGLSFWLPFFGTGEKAVATYDFRSCMCPGMIPCWDMRDKSLDYDLLRKLSAQWREIAPNFFGDYYPMTDYSQANNVWMSWQFDRPEDGQGMVQAFRRADCPDDTMSAHLQGLDKNADYVVTDIDTQKPVRMSGNELMKSGLLIRAESKPAAFVFTYKRTGN